MFQGIREDEVRRLLQNLSRHSRNQGFVKVEFKSIFADLTFNSLVRMIAGKIYYGEDVIDDSDEAKEFRELVAEIIENGDAWNLGDYLPILKWVGNYDKKLMVVAKRMDAFLQGLIDERRRNAKGRNTMIDHLLSLNELEPERYNDQIIKGLISASQNSSVYYNQTSKKTKTFSHF